MNPAIDPLRVSSLKRTCAARPVGHDAEKSATTMEEMLVRGGKQLMECLSGEGI